MSDLAAYGAGAGTGLVMVIVLYAFLWDEMVVEFKRLFEEPDGIGSQGPDSGASPTAGYVSDAPLGQQAAAPRSQRRKARVALGLYALVGVCLLGAGLLAGQTLAVAVGALNLVLLIGYLLVYRRRKML